MNGACDYGAILLNMGGPADEGGVEDYVYRMLADPYVLRLPLGFAYRRALARLIASRRRRDAAHRYRLIGGGSPLPRATGALALALERHLGVPVAAGMRYTRPRVAEGLALLEAAGAARVIAVPLFPQYSGVSTGSALADLSRHARGLQIIVVREHHRSPGYIEALAGLVRDRADPATAGRGLYVLYAAHSLPVSYTRRGDPYVSQVEETAEAVQAATGLNSPWSTAYQSPIGPIRWQRPTVAEALDRIVAEGTRRLVVVPVSFVSENLETLFDLDIELRRIAGERGIVDYRRVPTVDHSPRYVEALATLVRERLRGMEVRHA